MSKKTYKGYQSPLTIPATISPYSSLAKPITIILLLVWTATTLEAINENTSYQEIFDDKFIFFNILMIGYIFYEYIQKKPTKITIGKNKFRVFYNLYAPVTENLENFNFLIRKTESGFAPFLRSKHYAYCVYLIHKKHTDNKFKETDILTPSFHIWHRNVDGVYQISNVLLTSENLKEYVDSIKKQMRPQLKVLFDSKNVKADFETGEYQAKTR